MTRLEQLGGQRGTALDCVCMKAAWLGPREVVVVQYMQAPRTTIKQKLAEEEKTAQTRPSSSNQELTPNPTA